MTKHRTADLEGALLDAAVAMAEGYKTGKFSDKCFYVEALGDGSSVCLIEPHPGFDCLWIGEESGSDTGAWLWNPSASWSHAGPIIERERIATAWLWSTDEQGEVSRLWCAFIGAQQPWHIDERVSTADGTGPTLPIAAMRAYVASKFGEEVELP